MENTEHKKISVSVGIPAYNEEANIAHLLRAILGQKEDGFVLKEILVISDGSNDKTVEIVRSIQDNRISVTDDAKRKGQAERQNEITQSFSGDILVLLNADILPTDTTFLKELIKPIQENEHVGLVGCENIPLPPRNTFEKIINFSIDLKNNIYKEWNEGNNIYACRGTARAFSKDFAKKITWKDAACEDSYSYLCCISNTYLFKFSYKAKIYLRSPNNFNDHMKQSARFMNSHFQLYRYFSKDSVDKAFQIPKKIILKNVFLSFIKNPILFISYISIYFLIKVHPDKKKYNNNLWAPSKSSKSLI